MPNETTKSEISQHGLVTPEQALAAHSAEEKQRWDAVSKSATRYFNSGGETLALAWARQQRDLTLFITGDSEVAKRQGEAVLTRCREQGFRPDVTPQSHAIPIHAPRRSTYEQRQSGKPKADNDRSRQRKCLTCGGHFLSEGPHNRRCNSCTNQLHDTGSPGQMIEQMAV